MMDPMNRVNPDEVLPPSGTKIHAELEMLQAEIEERQRAMQTPLPESKGIKGCHPQQVIYDEVPEFEPTREERRQDILDRRAIAAQQSQRAALAAKRGKTVLRKVPTTARGRR